MSPRAGALFPCGSNYYLPALADASGNIFITVNYGATWIAVFDKGGHR